MSAVVKLAKNEFSSACNIHQQNGFVSDASDLQAEDVYEGISSPKCHSFVRRGSLKPQKFADVSNTTGGLLIPVYLVLLTDTCIRKV